MREATLVRFLSAYAILFFVSHLVPLDATANVPELAQKFREGRVVLVPFGSGLEFWEGVRDVLLSVPIGALGRLIFGARFGIRRSWLASTAALAVLEVGQLPIYSRYTDVTDVLLGSIGACLGVIIAGGRFGAQPRRKADNARGTHHLWSWPCAVAWILILAHQQWSPFDFHSDQQFLRVRLEQLPLVPFQNYYYSPLPLAFAELMRKLLLGIPLGILLAPTRHRKPQSTDMWLQISAAMFTIAVTLSLIEAVQLVVPSRTPDPTDVIIQTAGAFAGWWGVTLAGAFPLRRQTTRADWSRSVHHYRVLRKRHRS
jgi:glycopeptide antibiotics resistance protein